MINIFTFLYNQTHNLLITFNYTNTLLVQFFLANILYNKIALKKFYLAKNFLENVEMLSVYYAWDIS